MSWHISRLGWPISHTEIGQTGLTYLGLTYFATRDRSTQKSWHTSQREISQPGYHELCWRIVIHNYFLQRPGPLRGECEFARQFIELVGNSIQYDITFAPPNLFFTFTNNYLFLCMDILMADLGWPISRCEIGQLLKRKVDLSQMRVDLSRAREIGQVSSIYLKISKWFILCKESMLEV